MKNATSYSIQDFCGPSLFAPYPAIVARAKIKRDEIVTKEEVREILSKINLPALTAAVTLKQDSYHRLSLVHTLAQALLDTIGDSGLSVDYQEEGQDDGLIIAQFYDQNAAIIALKAAFGIADEFFFLAKTKSLYAKGLSPLITAIDGAIKTISGLSPHGASMAIIQVARKRGVPVRSLVAHSNVWQLGDGACSFHFSGTITSYDSAIGAKIAKNKYVSKLLISSLGFPVPKFNLVVDLAAAKSTVRAIGYPVVLKPNLGANGEGVTSKISNDRDLEAAFRAAASANLSIAHESIPQESALLIEKHVRGEDYRIVVIGGEFGWAVKRLPAQVIGDGQRTITQLIDAENKRRASVNADGEETLAPIPLDTILLEYLNSLGLTLDQVLPRKQRLKLREAANVSLGGTIEDCSSVIHPDNVEMAARITRAFRLDTAGIDFITEDITKSWRKTACAVIEINEAPGFSLKQRAELILSRRFPARYQGRIPIFIAVEPGSELQDCLLNTLAPLGEGIYHINHKSFAMNGFDLGSAIPRISEKVSAALVDPNCRAMVIGMTAEAIQKDGLPSEYCSGLVIPPNYLTSEPLRSLLREHSSFMTETLDKGEVERLAQKAIRNLASTRSGNEAVTEQPILA
jgi:D-alanine-D-alanine ligase-like ATP-grasp enzyme